jgi:hypothetical protein
VLPLSATGSGKSEFPGWHRGPFEPCLPSPADKPPSGPNWIHEIKHDGYRLMARRDPVGIRLLTRSEQAGVDPQWLDLKIAVRNRAGSAAPVHSNRGQGVSQNERLFNLLIH